MCLRIVLIDERAALGGHIALDDSWWLKPPSLGGQRLAGR